MMESKEGVCDNVNLQFENKSTEVVGNMGNLLLVLATEVGMVL